MSPAEFRSGTGPDPAHLAFDSLPATLDQAGWADHAGLQLAALVTRPLVATDPASAPGGILLGANEVTGSADGRRHDFRVATGPRWADGSPLTAGDYATAVTRAARSRTVTGYWLRGVRTVESRGDWMQVVLDAPDHGFPRLTGLPALCPQRAPGDGVGRYRLDAAGPRTLRLLRAPHAVRTGPERLVVRRIKDPERGLAGYRAGRVDVTSDTAFPLTRMGELATRPDFHAQRTGVVMALGFERTLLGDDAFCTRQEILSAMRDTNLSRLLPPGLVPISGFAPRPDFSAALAVAIQRVPDAPAERGPSTVPRFRLAYDTYYPNREVARAVADVLAAAGIPVRLVPDRYEHHEQSAELRLQLFRGLRGDELGIHRGLMFGDAVRTHPVLDEWVGLLAAHDAAPQADPAATAAALDRLLRRYALAVPLAEVPGLFLSRLGAEPYGWAA